MRSIVKKWGNSAAVRIPAAIMESAQLSLDQPLEITEQGGVILLTPAPKTVPDLETLIAGITDENRHGEVAFGPAVGREFW